MKNIRNLGMMGQRRVFIQILLLCLPIFLCGQNPHLMLPVGHTDAINSCSYSPDGKYIVSASNDLTAKIWSAEDGLLLMELKSHVGKVVSARYSPDGKMIVTASYDSTAKIWDAANGKVIRGVKALGYIYFAMFSPDEQYLLTSSSDGTASIWEVSTGKLVHAFQVDGFVFNAKYNSTGSRFIMTSSDSVVRIWDPASEKLIDSLKIPGVLFFNATFSPDGQNMVTASSDHIVRIWRVADKTVLHKIYWKGYNIYSPNYSPDGKELLTACEDRSAKIWDVEHGHLIRTFDLRGHVYVYAASFSPDGKHVLSSCMDISAQVWDTAGKIIHELKGHNSLVRSIVFSPDGKDIMVTGITSRIWNINSGKLAGEIGKPTRFGMSASVYSPDGKRVATSSYDSTAKVWDLKSGKMIFSLEGHQGFLINICYSPSGKYLATSCVDSIARIWDASTGRLLMELKGFEDYVSAVSFSPDEKTILTSSRDDKTRLWRLQDGKLLMVIPTCNGNRYSSAFSPDGKYFATAGGDSTARIWDAATGKLIRKMDGEALTVTYSPDGKYIASASCFENKARLWDASTGKMVREFSGHTNQVYFAMISPDGKYFITSSRDNLTKIWDLSTGEELYGFVLVDKTDYLVTDKDGHYDGTEGARKLLYYTCGLESIGLEQFKNLSWEPGLAGKRMGVNHEPITAKKISDINICSYTPLVEETGKEGDSYHYRVRSREGGVGEIQVYVNGKQVKKYMPGELPKEKDTYLVSVKEEEIKNYFVSGIDNEVSVKATTREGNMTSRGAVIYQPSLQKSTLSPHIYILSIGVSTYKGEKLRLGYASKDATDFSRVLSQAARKLLNTDGNEHCHTFLFNTEPGNQSWPSKTEIKKAIQTITSKATADDIVVLFFAGHGVLQSGDRRFYLLTADASTFDLAGVEKEVAISTDELNEWMGEIKAGKQLLILDACNSGQAVKNLQELIAKREIPADQQRALENLKDKTGTYILSASAAGQSAYETSLYGQGLLTYSLLSGIKLGGGLSQGKYIDVTKWFNYASDNVRELAKEIGGRQEPQIIGNASFDVGLVDRELLEGIKLSTRKKIFSRANIIKDGLVPTDNLGLSVFVDKQLNEISARGEGSQIGFIADNTLLDAYTILGRYTVKEDVIAIKLFLMKGTNEEDMLYQFEMKGTLDKKEDLAKQIVQMVQDYLNK